MVKIGILFISILFLPWVIFFFINFVFDIPFYINIVYIMVCCLLEFAFLQPYVQIKQNQKIETKKQSNIVSKINKGGCYP